jgi:hypothetical protein
MEDNDKYLRIEEEHTPKEYLKQMMKDKLMLSDEQKKVLAAALFAFCPHPEFHFYIHNIVSVLQLTEQWSVVLKRNGF